MSGKVTGWVLDNGPRPDDIDRDGNAYGLARARCCRLVLLPITDAANAQGEHAHPGLDAIVEASLYSRRSVIACIDFLVAEGWLIVERKGGGRGRSTVYNVPMVVPETVQRDCTLSTRETVQPARSNGAESPVNGATPPPSSCGDASTNGHNVKAQRNPSSTAVADDGALPGIVVPIDEHAAARKAERAVCAETWERVDSICSQRVQAGHVPTDRVRVRSVLQHFAKLDVAWERLEAAMVSSAAMTINAVEAALNIATTKQREQRGRTTIPGVKRGDPAWAASSRVPARRGRAGS